MLTDLKKRINLKENFNKEIEELNQSHSELKNKVAEMEYTVEGMNN